ncbi:putative PIN2/TERF1-interacting telomerase inhibitor 1 isoform [Sesbania bispinosa]|nr:putative PIN2/TERF1-interacting telomerase inhibitor 1 isoform [Sesbania bispinosa]
MKRGRNYRERVVQPESEDTWSDEVESEHADKDVGGDVGHRQQYASSAGFGVNVEGPNPHLDSDYDERFLQCKLPPEIVTGQSQSTRTVEVSDVNTTSSNSQPQPSIHHTKMQGTSVRRARGLIPRSAMRPKLNTR